MNQRMRNQNLAPPLAGYCQEPICGTWTCRRVRRGDKPRLSSWWTLWTSRVSSWCCTLYIGYCWEPICWNPDFGSLPRTICKTRTWRTVEEDFLLDEPNKEELAELLYWLLRTKIFELRDTLDLVSSWWLVIWWTKQRRTGRSSILVIVP